MANEIQIWTGCKISEDTLGEAFRVSVSLNSEDRSYLAAINTFFLSWKKYSRFHQRDVHSTDVVSVKNHKQRFFCKHLSILKKCLLCACYVPSSHDEHSTCSSLSIPKIVLWRILVTTSLLNGKTLKPEGKVSHTAQDWKSMNHNLGSLTLEPVLSSPALDWSKCTKKSDEMGIWLFTKYGLSLAFRNLKSQHRWSHGL